MTASEPVLRREVVLVLVLTILGAVLRMWSLGLLGLQHFDEGIYALSGLWILAPGGLKALDPTLIPYAPPALTILIGASYGVLGVSDLAAIAVSLVCGTATVPVAAWLGRRTFGPGAGAAAAAFAVFAAPHVSFSRMALTDVPFLLSWLVSLGCGILFLEKPRIGRALVFGAAVGLAQNFKYNGWLAGIVVGLVAVFDLLSGRLQTRIEAARLLALGALAALIAAFVYLPWFLFVEAHGGYASLLKHHRSYMGSISTWLPHLKTQLDQAIALSGGPYWELAAWAMAWLGWAFSVHGWLLVGLRGSRQNVARFLVGMLCGLAALAMLPALPWWIGLGSCCWLLLDDRPSVRVLAIWWLILSIATPFYHPYARLWLPLHAAGWLLLAGLIARLAQVPAVAATPRTVNLWRRRGPAVVSGLVLVMAVWQQYGSPQRARPLSGVLGSSDALRTIVAQVRPDPDSAWTGSPSSVDGLARPPVQFYYMTGVGQWPYRPQPNFEGLVQAARPNDLVVLDEVLLRQEPPGSPGAAALSRLLDVPARLDPLNGPTLLDVDPGAMYGHSFFGQKADASASLVVPDSRPSARVWILTGRELKRIIAP